MDLAEACFHMRHRRRMYVMDDRFESVIAFIHGLSAATDGRLLEGFNEWAAERVLGHRTSHGYWSFVRERDGRGELLDDDVAVELLLDLLEEFSAREHRGAPGEASSIAPRLDRP